MKKRVGSGSGKGVGGMIGRWEDVVEVGKEVYERVME